MNCQQNPAITFIIPAYNAERTLERTLDSIPVSYTHLTLPTTAIV